MSDSRDRDERVTPELSRDMVDGLRSATTLVQEMLTRSEESAAKYQAFASELERQGAATKRLLNIVRDGDNPLTDRVLLIETELKSLGEQFRSWMEQEKAGRWGWKIAIVQGLFALAAAGLALVGQHLLKTGGTP